MANDPQLPSDQEQPSAADREEPSAPVQTPFVQRLWAALKQILLGVLSVVKKLLQLLDQQVLARTVNALSGWAERWRNRAIAEPEPGSQSSLWQRLGDRTATAAERLTTYYNQRSATQQQSSIPKESLSEGEEPNEIPPSRTERIVERAMVWLEGASRRWGGRDATPTLLLLAIAGFMVLMIGWASIAELDHVVRGTGKVVTPQQTQLIQSLEGGIIERIFVQEGDAVTEGSVLVSLDPTQAKSLYGEAKNEERSLQVRVERLRAEKDRSAPVFSYELMRDMPEVISAEKAQLRERQAVLDNEIQLLEAQVSQRQEEQKQAENELARAQKGYELAEAEYTLIKDLVDRRLEAKLSLITSDRDRNEAIAKLNSAKVSLKKTAAVLAEAQFRLSQAQMQFVSEVGQEYAQGIARLGEVQERLQGLRDRLSRTQLTAPLNALVNKIHIRTQGGVVQPGEPILELTPMDGSIEIEATILQKDIAFVYVGQETSVKLTAFDFSRFGDIGGKVKFISPDAQQSPEGGEFFQVRIELDRAYIESNGQRYPITPGMAANIDMVVAKRTVMEYLIEPVLKLRDRAFRE